MWWIIRAATGLSMGSVLMLAMIILGLGMSVGMQVGYEADSAQNASVQWNGTHLTAGANVSDQILPQEEQDFEDMNRSTKEEGQQVPKELRQFNESIDTSNSELENSSVGRFRERVTVSQIDRLLTAISVVADSYASFFFNHRDEIPRDIAKAYSISWTLGMAGLSLKMLAGDIR